MARLEGGFCAKTVELEMMVSESQLGPARVEAVRLLRDGYSSRPFLCFVADLLDPAVTRGRGRPRGTPGVSSFFRRFEELRHAGATYEVAIGTIAEEAGVNERTVGRAIALYLAAPQTHGE